MFLLLTSESPQFKKVPETSLIPGALVGSSFTTVTIDTPPYLSYLFARFISRGGSIVRGGVQHISQVIEGGPNLFRLGKASPEPIDALVVCPGLGARTLGGVEDNDVYPVRGQIVIIRAPWVDFGRTASHAEQGLWTYVIPRRSGDVGSLLSVEWHGDTDRGRWRRWRDRSSLGARRKIMIGTRPHARR